jgi:peptidoglycan hydrolase CwlO-like protein
MPIIENAFDEKYKNLLTKYGEVALRKKQIEEQLLDLEDKIKTIIEVMPEMKAYESLIAEKAKKEQNEKSKCSECSCSN